MINIFEEAFKANSVLSESSINEAKERKDNKKDLSKVERSMTKILSDHSDELAMISTKAELLDYIKGLFDDEKLDTPATKRLIANVSKSKNINDAFQTVYNSILSGTGNSVINVKNEGISLSKIKLINEDIESFQPEDDIFVVFSDDIEDSMSEEEIQEIANSYVNKRVCKCGICGSNYIYDESEEVTKDDVVLSDETDFSDLEESLVFSKEFLREAADDEEEVSEEAEVEESEDTETTDVENSDDTSNLDDIENIIDDEDVKETEETKEEETETEEIEETETEEVCDSICPVCGASDHQIFVGKITAEENEEIDENLEIEKDDFKVIVDDDDIKVEYNKDEESTDEDKEDTETVEEPKTEKTEETEETTVEDTSDTEEVEESIFDKFKKKNNSEDSDDSSANLYACIKDDKTGKHWKYLGKPTSNKKELEDTANFFLRTKDKKIKNDRYIDSEIEIYILPYTDAVKKVGSPYSRQLDLNIVSYKESADCDTLEEDTVKLPNGKWANKGEDGTHGTFKTKKAADAQRRAMFAKGFKAESVKCNEEDETNNSYSTKDRYLTRKTIDTLPNDLWTKVYDALVQGSYKNSILDYDYERFNYEDESQIKLPNGDYIMSLKSNSKDRIQAARDVAKYYGLEYTEDKSKDNLPQINILIPADKIGVVESSTRDDIDAKADMRKSRAKRTLMKKRDDIDADRDYELHKDNLKEADNIGTNLGQDIDDYQKWVDYDMKHFGRVSFKTQKAIKDAGLQLIKDQYGDYEVSAGDYTESCGKSKTEEDILLDNKSFDAAFTSFAKENYDNVSRVRFNKGSLINNSYIVLEGKVFTKSKSKRNIKLKSEKVDFTKRAGVLKLHEVGPFTESAKISKNKVPFVVNYKFNKNAIFAESLKYNYVVTEGKKSYKVSGSINLNERVNRKLNKNR